MKNYYQANLFRSIALLLAMSWPLLLQAQEERDLRPVSRTYAITNVNIIQGPGRKIDMGTVVIKDGLILSVGRNISIPAEAITIKADSMYLYAGFIDGLSRVGVNKPKEEPNRERPKDPGNPPAELAGIVPQNDVRTFLNPADKSVEELRALGFTTAQVVPYGGMLPGTSAIVLLGGKTADDMILVNKSAFYSELAGAQRVYPSTVIAVMAKWRELYRQAVLAKNYETLYASNRAGLERPSADRVLEAFYPVIDKRLPVAFKAEKYLEAQRVLALQTDLGFSVMIADLKEGWDAINKIKAANAKTFLSLDLPEEKKDEKKDGKEGDKPKADEPKKEEAKKEEPKKESKPKTAADLEKEALEKRREEFIALYVAQASVFQKAGVNFGFSSLSAKTKDIPANLRRMIKAGLTEDQALAALTTNPAQLLGLSDRMGSIDNGKMANLVISDKPYFNEKAKVRFVFVDGVMYKQEVKETKGDPNVKVDVAGNWSVTTETPQGKSETKVSFKKEGSNYSGTISGGRLPAPVNLDKVELEGNALKYSYTVQFDGRSFKVEVDAVVEGETYKGTASMGNFGSFPLEAKKDPNR
ncbi:MAG: amidohydrolase family protein [Bacteroidota bacterium]